MSLIRKSVKEDVLMCQEENENFQLMPRKNGYFSIFSPIFPLESTKTFVNHLLVDYSFEKY